MPERASGTAGSEMIQCFYCRQSAAASGAADDIADQTFGLCTDHSIMVLSTLRERLTATFVSKRAAASSVS